MKDYNEIASELFDRREEYEKEKKRKTKKAIAAGASVICAAAVAVGVSVRKNADKGRLQASETVPSEITVVAAEKVKVITSYPSDSQACYATPGNGTKFCSIELERAIEASKESGEAAEFLVQMWVFHDRNVIDNAGAVLMSECERLSKLGYKFYDAPVWEYQGEDARHIYRDEILGLFTLEQLENFDLNTEYGYFFDFVHNGDSSPLNVDDLEQWDFHPQSRQTSYDAPENGKIVLPDEVDSAIKSAGKKTDISANFLVSMGVFRDKKAVDNSVLMSECERLSKLGYNFYTVRVYEIQDGKYVYHNEIAGLLTLEQLENFDLNTEYGYLFEFIRNGDTSPVSVDNDCEPLTF